MAAPLLGVSAGEGKGGALHSLCARLGVGGVAAAPAFLGVVLDDEVLREHGVLVRRRLAGMRQVDGGRLRCRTS